jgi:hypothetical protein
MSSNDGYQHYYFNGFKNLVHIFCRLVLEILFLHHYGR